MPISESRLKLLTDALASTVESYKEHARIATLLDNKAQNTGAFAGVFLAAAFAFSRKENIADVVGFTGYVGVSLLLFCGTLFLVSLALGLWVMWVRTSKMPPEPRSIYEAVDVILDRAEEDDPDRRENHLRDQLRPWLEAVDDQKARNRRKGTLLLLAQTGVLAGMIVVLVIVGLVVVHAHSVHPQGWTR
jgi:hypothetical protein